MPIPKLVIAVGMMAAQVALGAMRKIEGPRLDDRKITLAEYGTPLPRFWGIRRFEGCPVPWAEDLREKKKKSKTKAGKYAEYKYYGTWMAVIADCEIAAVRKIYLDNHLVYQVAGTGPIAALIMTAIDPAAAGAEIKLEQQNLSTYLGTESQLPDPRMEAWYEDNPDFGPDSCPAHRGTAYLLFKDIPLEKFGNRIPQVSVEAVRVKSELFPYESFTTTQSVSGRFAFGGGWTAYWDSGGQIEWWDSSSRTLIGNSAGPGVLISSTALALGATGIAYGFGVTDTPTRVNLVVTPPLGTPALTEISDAASFLCDNIRVFGSTPFISYANTAGYIVGASHAAHSQVARDFCIDSYGDIWALFQPTGASDQFTLQNLTGGTTYNWTGSTSRSGVTPARVCFSQWGNFFVLGGDGYFYIISREDGSVVSSGAESWADSTVQLPAQVPGERSFWVFGGEYSLEDGSLIRSNVVADWGLVLSIAGMGYDPVLRAHWVRQTASTNIYILYVDRIGSSAVTLGTIVDEVSDWVGVTADVAALTQEIRGYAVVPGTAREMIEPLLDMHLSICRPHDFGVQFIKHSETSVSTIEVGEFVKDETRYTVETEQDTGLPREIVVTYAQESKDQQTNTVTTRRSSNAVDTVATQAINLETYVSSPDEMQQLADRYLRWRWNTRSTVTNGITAQYLAAEPGDVYDLDLDDVTWSCELQKQTFSDGYIKCEWKRVFPSLNTLGSNAGPDMTGKDEDEIPVAPPVNGEVIDIPLVADVDSNSNPLLYYWAGGYGIGFVGAVVYDGGLDGEEYEDWNAVSSSNGATWGYTTDALADVPSPWLWDRGNTVNVKVFGTLTTVTEAEIDADPSLNLAYLGTELLNFTTATLEADGTYTLSGFKRGRRGTEWATDDHTTGESFVLVSDLANDARGMSEVGEPMYFKVQSYGRDPEMAEADTFTFTGASLKPYAPARIEWTTDGTDLFGEITRRTRIGGSWSDDGVVPLSENSEAYEVDVMDGNDVLRTITVSATNVFTYTAAQISADGGSVSTPPTVNVYQLSDAVGRGFALAA